MRKLYLSVTLLIFIFTFGFYACNKNDIGGYTQIGVNKDTFNINASIDSSSCIKTTMNDGYIKKIELITNNKDTIINNTLYMKGIGKDYVYVFHDTITSNWCKVIKIKDDPTIFKVYLGKNSSNQERKAILTLDGIMCVPKNVTLIQQAN